MGLCDDQSLMLSRYFTEVPPSVSAKYALYLFSPPLSYWKTLSKSPNSLRTYWFYRKGRDKREVCCALCFLLCRLLPKFWAFLSSCMAWAPSSPAHQRVLSFPSLSVSVVLAECLLPTGQLGLALPLARLSPFSTSCDSGYTSSQPLLHLSLHVRPGAATQISLGNNWPNASNPWQKQAPGREGALATQGNSTAPQSRGLLFTTTCWERIINCWDEEGGIFLPQMQFLCWEVLWCCVDCY